MPSALTRRALIASLAAAPFGAAYAQAPRALSAADQAAVKSVEDYLNAMKTFKAHFVQIDNNGGSAEGTLYISRPGKLRVDYDPPNPNLLIANGSFLIHYDRQLKSPAYLPLNSTPAGLLVRDHVSFTNDVVVLGVEHGPQVLRLAVAQKNDLKAGRVTFVFGENPFVLNSWQVTDPQGAVTRVSLFDAQSGLKLDPALFVFRDPATFGEGATR